MRLLKGAFAALVIAYFGALGALYVKQRAYVFSPDRDARGPAESGLPEARPLRLSSGAGVELAAWYIPPADARPLVLFFHGKGGALPSRAPRLRAIAADGTGVLAVEYRGFGASGGEPSEAGLIEDAQAAYARALDLGFAADRIVFIGESLGTGVAVALATTRPARAIILDSPFTSIADVAAGQYWMFPVRPLLRDPFHSDERIKDVHAPLLILHGERDETVPFPFGQRLFSLANEPKTFIDAPSLGHLTLADPAMMQRARDWLAGVLAERQGAGR